MLLGLLALLLVAAVILHPSQAFDASMQGLHYWWNILFPALLPYYILCEIVLAYGFARRIGRFIAPLATRLLRLPAAGAEVIPAALLSGYISGAELAAKLRKDKQITRAEAERMTMLAHSANPLFLLSVIGAVLLHRPDLGIYIVFIHYCSMFICALVLRYYSPASEKPAPMPLIRAAQSPRSFGSILGDSVADSLQRLLQLGGIIMMISVSMRMTAQLGILPDTRFASILTGILEIHLGAQRITESLSMTPGDAIAWLCAITAWGGAITHLQVRAAMQNTDIRYMPYLFIRLMQAVVAYVLASLLWGPFLKLQPWTSASIASLEQQADTTITSGLWPVSFTYPQIYTMVIVILIALLARRHRR